MLNLYLIILLLDIYSRKIRIHFHKKLYKTFTVALFIIAKKKEKTTNVHQQQKSRQMQYVYTMEYYSEIKRKDLLIHARTWVNYRDVTLSKRIQTQKSAQYSFIYMTFYLYDILEQAKLQRWKSEQWLLGAGSREQVWTTKGHEEFSGAMEILCIMTIVTFAQCTTLSKLIKLYP